MRCVVDDECMFYMDRLRFSVPCCFAVWAVLKRNMSELLYFFLIAVEAFKQTDVDYLKEEKGYNRDSGSTASTAVLVGDRIVVANVGDSRVVASRAGSGWCILSFFVVCEKSI